MDIAHTAETWLFYGICDLYFSFHTQDLVFDNHAAFSGIMALEKHLKGALIFGRGAEFSTLGELKAKAKDKVQSIAKEYGHDFQKMISACNEQFGEDHLNRIVGQDYGGYNGSQLLIVLKSSYMETRYPTTTNVSSQFPIDKNEGIYHNPLSSSGLHDFIFSICGFIIVNLSPAINENKLLGNVTKQYEHLESFSRFKNLYLSGHW